MKNDNFVDSFIALEIKKRKDVNKIISNYDYINWVDSYMRDKTCVYDDDPIYNNESIAKKDFSNIYLISALFCAIEKYAKDNYIYPQETEFGFYYNINYLLNGYKVGAMAGQGVTYYIKKCDDINLDSCLNFEDIINNKRQDNYLNIKERLENLKEEIINSCEDNVPIEAIEETVEDTIKKLKKKHS